MGMGRSLIDAQIAHQRPLERAARNAREFLSLHIAIAPQAMRPGLVIAGRIGENGMAAHGVQEHAVALAKQSLAEFNNNLGDVLHFSREVLTIHQPGTEPASE